MRARGTSCQPSALLVGLAFIAAGCKRPAPDDARKVAPAASASLARQLPSPGAFDLISTDDGAVLVWSSRSGGELQLTLLDASGTAVRSEPLLSSVDAGPGAPSTEISEVAAMVHGGDLAVAWLERGQPARARAFVRPLAGGGAGRVIELGAVLDPVSVPRGNLAITMHDGHFAVLARGQKSDCIEPAAHDCVSFGFHRLGPASAEDQGLPLTVPLPCAQNSVSFAVSASRWYYGVCSQATGKPVTTVFSIQQEPQYARADRVLEGCLPLGALSQNDELWLVADCPGEGQRRGVRLRAGNAEPLDLRVDRLEAVCRSGAPLIRQTGSVGLNLPLLAPRDGLAAFLPAALSPAVSRAAWTGRTLLVASPSQSSITLKGYQCDSTLLREVVLTSAPSGSRN